jgi:hypothetical protein
METEKMGNAHDRNVLVLLRAVKPLPASPFDLNERGGVGRAQFGDHSRPRVRGGSMGYWSRFARQGDLDKGAQGLAGECLFDGRIAST